MSCPQVIKVVTPGPPGPAGPTGPAGVGSAWLQAAGVPAAGDGGDGDYYLDTETGNIYGPKTDGAWGGVIFNIAEGQQGPAGATGATGATGPAGADGRTLLSGTSAPSGGIGGDGDFFINTNGSIIYGPKAGGVWPSGVSLVGPTGATGASGPTGPTGPQGPAGETGATGPQGPKGDTGDTGPAGPTGATGPAGADAVYSDATPQALGTAAAGTAPSASRADHVHALPPLVSTTNAGLQAATSFAALAYAATVDLDMAALDGQARTITLTDALSLTASNRAAGRRVVLRLLPGAAERALTFPADWVFVSAKPANIAASKSAVLSLTFFGSADADCIAAYAVQP